MCLLDWWTTNNDPTNSITINPGSLAIVIGPAQVPKTTKVL
jgi:hypothetical protein